MNHSTSKNVDLIVTAPDDCGNAPRKIILRELNIAFAKKDISLIVEGITDDFHWNIINKKVIQGKKELADTIKKLPNRKALELHISNIITHGKTASLDGTLLLDNNQRYAFCNVYNFASAGRNAKLKDKTSYVIELT